MTQGSAAGCKGDARTMQSQRRSSACGAHRSSAVRNSALNVRRIPPPCNAALGIRSRQTSLAQRGKSFSVYTTSNADSLAAPNPALTTRHDRRKQGCKGFMAEEAKNEFKITVADLQREADEVAAAAERRCAAGRERRNHSTVGSRARCLRSAKNESDASAARNCADAATAQSNPSQA